MGETVILESDEELYSRYLSSRDEEALRTLLERHGERLTLFLYGYVHNMEDAEDLMLDAFARAAARESWSIRGSSFKTWLFAIGRKLALMHLRKQKTAEVSLSENHADSKNPPDLDLLRNERDLQLYQAVKQLKPEYAQALTLIYFENMTHEEAARVMRKTRKQIYHLVSRGRERLKEILKGMGIEDAQY